MNEPVIHGLTEIEAAHRLGCKRLSEARRVLRRYPPAVTLPDGPRWTDAQIRVILGAESTDDPVAAKARMLARIAASAQA